MDATSRLAELQLALDKELYGRFAGEPEGPGPEYRTGTLLWMKHTERQVEARKKVYQQRVDLVAAAVDLMRRMPMEDVQSSRECLELTRDALDWAGGIILGNEQTWRMEQQMLAEGQDR